METQLSLRQQKFVDEVLVDANGTAAAIRAGVPSAGAHVWASRALRNPKVAAVVAARQADDSARLDLDRQKVIAGLLEAIDKAREQANPAAMIAGWREIAKMLGLYEPVHARVKVDAMVAETEASLSALSDGELARLIEAGQKA